ncbi:MAG: endonuclease domain-containing protein [Rhodospirillales bacterium]
MKRRAIIARRLRRDPTDAERRLWNALREAQLPWRVRRQHPIGEYIVDLAVPVRKLAIELDGGQHDANRAADAQRTAELEKHGYRVIRFWNNEVLGNLDGVMHVVLRELSTSCD